MFNLEEELKKLPDKPGVYIMHDKHDTIIYVGKAKILKNRVRQYFQSNKNHSAKVVQMVSHIAYFEYILNQNHIDPATDLTIDQNIDFGSTAAAFAEDKSDYDFTVEFEPGATNLEKQGKGYVVASLGTDSGYVPYTAFSAKKSYINKHPEVVQGFTNALQKGMDYVASHTPEDIAQAIAPQFKETTLDTITTIISRYYEQDTWKKDLIFRQESFDLLQDILEEAGELKEHAPYKDLVTTTYAEKAAKTSNDTQKTN